MLKKNQQKKSAEHTRLNNEIVERLEYSPGGYDIHESKITRVHMAMFGLLIEEIVKLRKVMERFQPPYAVEPEGD